MSDRIVGLLGACYSIVKSFTGHIRIDTYDVSRTKCPGFHVFLCDPAATDIVVDIESGGWGNRFVAITRF